MRRRGRSGQVLVVTSLVVVTLLLSTVVYVLETEKNAPVCQPASDLSLGAVKLAALHTLTSALVNVSGGGDPAVLAGDLALFKSDLEHYSYSSSSQLNCQLTYSSEGVWVSWGTEGEGVSSASVDFAFNFSGSPESYFFLYPLNLTSKVTIEGTYVRLHEGLKDANITINVSSDGAPAEAKVLDVYYYHYANSSGLGQGWDILAPPQTISYGNGTYALSFTADTKNRNDPLLVSAHFVDPRGVSVWANATCTLLP